jgi:hypothetical protein
MKTLFNRSFLIRWTIYSIFCFLVGMFVQITGFSRWLSGNSESIQDWFNSFLLNPFPQVLCAIIVGFILAKFHKSENYNKKNLKSNKELK